MISSLTNAIFGTSEEMQFHDKKNKLAQEVHKVFCEFMEDSSYKCVPSEHYHGDKNKYFYQIHSKSTNETLNLFVNLEELRSHIPDNFSEIEKSLDKTTRACYHYFLKFAINDIIINENNNKIIVSDVLKKAENIENLNNSTLLKVSVLTFVQDWICTDEENRSMLDERKCEWWNQ